MGYKELAMCESLTSLLLWLEEEVAELKIAVCWRKRDAAGYSKISVIREAADVWNLLAAICCQKGITMDEVMVEAHRKGELKMTPQASDNCRTLFDINAFRKRVLEYDSRFRTDNSSAEGRDWNDKT